MKERSEWLVGMLSREDVDAQTKRVLVESYPLLGRGDAWVGDAAEVAASLEDGEGEVLVVRLTPCNR